MKRFVFGTPIVFAVIAVMAGPGCLGTETGNPPFAPEVGYGGYDPMGFAPDPTLSRAQIGIDEVVLIDCVGDRHALLRRLLIDVVTGDGSVGETLEVPSGTYCGIEIGVAACSDPDLCRTVEPSSVAISGLRRVDAADVEIRDEAPLDITLEGSFELSETAGGVLFAIDRTLLTSGLEIATLPASPDGVVRIDATNNADRLPLVRDALRRSLSLRRDLDGDGVLDREELTPPPLAIAP